MDSRLSEFHSTLGTANVVDERGGGLWQGDAIDLLGRLPDASVNLVLTSPPYNIGKPYDRRRTIEEYIEWCATWIAQIERILTPTGAAWINLGYLPVPGRGTAVPIAYLLWPHLGGLHLVQELVWHQTNGVACRRRLSPRNEKLLWLVRDPASYVFNLDPIRDPNVAYPNQRRAGRLRCNPLGKNPGDVWTVPRVTAGRRSDERTDHPAQMPLRVAEQVILAVTNPGDVVLDPFAGSGTTLVATLQLGRRSAGFELRSDYLAIARSRLEAE
jgi:adenine-specific DNA-methyltransferase